MKKYFKVLLVLIMFIAMPVFASSNDLFRAEDNVSVNENLNGSSFIAGNNVDVDSKVNGILFSAGNQVSTAGESEYAFVAGNFVKLDSQKFIDGFIAGNIVEIKDVEVQRDMYVAGSTVTYAGNTGRNLFIGGSTVTIKGIVKGDLTVYAENITIDSNAEINGTLKYSSDSKVNISKNAKVGYTEIEEVKNNTSIKAQTFKSKITDSLFSLMNILVIGLLMMLIIPKVFEKIAKQDEKSLLTNLGFGAVSLIAAPIAALILITTLIGMSTGFVLLGLYIICIYISTVFTSYYLSNMILKNKVKNKYLIYLIGAVALTVLKLIPFVSILTTICTLCIGLGLIVNLLFNRK
ncbi:MAG: hypothetical protein J6O56_03965 [Bacilli bacterium]|nr:hypothetical protein [Bacilli bacterium]